ncbi:hypothetical protein [Moorena sp. SIO3B2]|uniref:hypothetical protein n=1 Tax=Moorena sp. SIO3B2 TaxID=2607827 RepID=UPI0002EB0868|nr:hypothetical protein [Moorena sp. SIO3B2]NEP35627.1 hypothetical protein [Moorena sp. SIO3B2]
MRENVKKCDRKRSAISYQLSAISYSKGNREQGTGNREQEFLQFLHGLLYQLSAIS